MDILDLSTVSSSNANRSAFLDQLCDRLELQYASYALQDPLTGQTFAYSNYGHDWRSFYAENGFHRLDPAILRARKSIAPVLWSRFQADDGFAEVFSRASDFGIPTTGVTVPIRGPYGECGLLLASRPGTEQDWVRHSRSIMGDLQTGAVHFHDHVMSGEPTGRLLFSPQLSTRERDVLQWIAAGKTQQDVSDILSIATRTVEVHLRSARDKLNALTTAQAVGRAVRMGLIQPG